MDNEKYFDELCDSVDATVFNGDLLDDREQLNKFKQMLFRWANQSNIIEDSINKQEKLNEKNN